MRVKAAIVHGVILVFAGLTERIRVHRGARAIVRHLADDRVSRAAGGAIREGIAVTAIPGRANFP